jgi:NAD-dependent oxidoreductase involved in siderophore biosynthesis
LGFKTSTIAATPALVLGAGSKRSRATSQDTAIRTLLSSDIISFGIQAAVIGVFDAVVDSMSSEIGRNS